MMKQHTTTTNVFIPDDVDRVPVVVRQVGTDGDRWVLKIADTTFFMTAAQLQSVADEIYLAAAACDPDALQLPDKPSVEPSADPEFERLLAEEEAIERRVAGGAADRGVGAVKFYNRHKGYGFISRVVGDDVFVHASHVGELELLPGMPVSFSYAPHPKGLQATNLTILPELSHE